MKFRCILKTALVLLLPCCFPAELPAVELAAWSGEGGPYHQIEGWMDILVEQDVDIYLNIREEDLSDPDLMSLIRECNASGVEIRAWLVLPVELGYWPSEISADEMFAFSERFLDWTEANQLDVRWICVDMEIPIQQSRLLTELLENGQFLKAAYILARNMDEESFEYAVSVYTDLVESAHARGVSVHCVTFPQVLDDFQDGDHDLQDALQLPVLPVPWDEISVMVYRSHYRDIFGFDMGAYLVYDYSKDIERLWGGRGCIDLGVVGDPGYADSRCARADARGIKAAGVGKVHFYSLELILEPGGEGIEWFRAVREAGPRVPLYRPAVSLMRGSLQLLDWMIWDFR